MNLCKDCVYFIPPESPWMNVAAYAKCRRTEKPNPVTGGVIASYCLETRVFEIQCGPEGRWFEPMPEQQGEQTVVMTAREAARIM